MDCSNCALTINRYLEKKGMKNVKVNFASGDVSFEKTNGSSQNELAIGLKDLGYPVKTVDTRSKKFEFLTTHGQRFVFCLPFTLVLMLHMFHGLHDDLPWIMNPYFQLTLTLPVYAVGMSYFGKSALKSLRNLMPNMNVLIALGATSAFVYSLYGTFTGQASQYMFYETAAAIITLVFLGNYLEDASVRSTQKALDKLVSSQKLMANMIAFDDQYQEQVFQVENTQLRVGDLVLIRTGEQVPIDAKVLWGTGSVDESIVTGESIPVEKNKKDQLIGGSILTSGTLKGQVTATGDDTVLSGIINMVRQAQGEKPPVQKMADRISAIFVPLVIVIAIITLGINWIVLDSFTPSLMRAIAVLVIACPCAMGLATPAAIAVGLGRAARNGVLFRNAAALEQFKDIKQVVFDKTGTLTSGKFAITGSYSNGRMDKDTFRKIVYSLEKYSDHPIAKSIAGQWKSGEEIRWKEIEEVKGTGIRAVDESGDEYWAGSNKILQGEPNSDFHNVYVTKNGELIGWIDIKDELRPESKMVVTYLNNKGIKTILLSGDREEKCKIVAEELGIKEYFAEQKPAQKLETIARLSAQTPTAMVGDGINDAPALAKATIGISMSEASQLAMQSADVVLMNNDLNRLPLSLGLGKHTYLTIKQNLFWAFSYNIVAIPVAALGFLTPTFGALVMGLSDVVLGVNSVRLFVKKVA